MNWYRRERWEQDNKCVSMLLIFFMAQAAQCNRFVLLASKMQECSSDTRAMPSHVMRQCNNDAGVKQLSYPSSLFIPFSRSLARSVGQAQCIGFQIPLCLHPHRTAALPNLPLPHCTQPPLLHLPICRSSSSCSTAIMICLFMCWSVWLLSVAHALFHH